MIQTILLYDDKDVRLGDFFRLCANMCRYLHDTHFSQGVIIEYKSNSRRDEIELSVSKHNDNNFMFISYLHGDDDALYLSNEKIISRDNAYLFANAFFYTSSCCCGKNLSRILLDNQALVFWGYKDTVLTMQYYEECFAELAISGLKHFLSNEIVEIAYNNAKDEYTEKIDAIYQENFVVAANLLHNRDAMVVYGDKHMTISDFIIK